MAKIELEDIWHTYKSIKKKEIKETVAIRGISLCWEDGSANALLGPSGCGKTTLLNIISGLLKPTRGRVLFNGKDVTDLTPQERNVALVFQFPVNYDSMNIFDNLAFPLRNEKLPEKEVERRVKEVAKMLDLSDRLYVPALLLDEPLTDVDPQLKWSLRRKIKEVQMETKITTIYVTHDQHEALTFADKIAVMKEGQVVQVGTPEELYLEPKTPFVGFFIGSPGMNFLECSLNNRQLKCGKFSIQISPKMESKLVTYGSKFLIGIRPEFVQISKDRQKNWFPFDIEVIEDTGRYKILTLVSNDLRIKSRAPEEMRISEGEKVWVNFPEEKIKIYKDDTLIV